MYASRQLCLTCFASSGNVSSGKSTFINNLLPSNLLPTKHLHSTGKMCRIRKGRPNERKIQILTIDEQVIGEYNNLDMLAELADVKTMEKIPAMKECFFIDLFIELDFLPVGIL